MAFLKQTHVSGNLYVTHSGTWVEATEFRGPLTGTASFANSASNAVTASHALNINPSADITVHDFTATGDAQVNGNLTVNGELVYVGTTDLRVKDKFIELNVAPSGSTPVSADGAGIVIRNSEGTTGADAAMVYDGTKDVLYFNKPISASLDVTASQADNAVSASHAVQADTASLANQVLNNLKLGAGLTNSGSDYNGSGEVTVAVDQSYIQAIQVISASRAVSAEQADSVANNLSVSDAQNKNRISGGPYNGSSAVTISLDLSDVDTAITGALTAASAAQADVDALETLVGTLPTSEEYNTVVDYANWVAKSASAAEDITGKLTPISESLVKVSATASAASAAAATNAGVIADLVSHTASYVTSVTEGSSTENFVSLTVGTGSTAKDAVITIDDTALSASLNSIEGEITDAFASASASRAIAEAATASAAANSASIAVLSGSFESLDATDIPVDTEGEHGYNGSNVQEVLDELDGRTSAAGITVETTGSTADYAAVYNIKQGGTTVGTINIPKDYLVKSGDVKTCTVQDEPVAGLVPGDKYLDFVVNTYDEPTGSASHIYIPVKDLTDVYTGADSGEITTTVDANNHISASIDNLAITGAKIANGTITKGKLADAVTASLDLADSAVQTIETGTTNGTIKVDGTEVAVAGLGSAAYEDTTAFDASGAAAAVSTSLSTSLATEVSRSTAAEVALGSRIDGISSSMTTIVTASGEEHLTLSKSDSTYTIGTTDIASATAFNSYTESVNTHLGTLDSASASLATAVSGAQYTASQALTTAVSASASAAANSESIATETSRSLAAEAALSQSISASAAAASDAYVLKAGDTMTGTLKAPEFQVADSTNNGYWSIVPNSADQTLEFVWVANSQ